jgi:cyanophycinase
MKQNIENACPNPSGILVIIGGKEKKAEGPDSKTKPENEQDSEVLKTFISLINKEDPVLEVITTASSLPDELFKEYNKAFRAFGVNKVQHIHHMKREEVLNDELPERVNKADGVFFSGGDQLLLTSIYGGTPFLTHLKEKYINQNLVIGGTSAGAMAMSTPMIYAGSEEVQQLGGEIKITTGLEFLRDVAIDTHFVHRGRFVRMAQVIATNPTSIGIGIEEDTAIIVRNGRDAEVIGSGTIIVIDGYQIGNSNVQEFENKEPVCIKNLRVDILKRGNTFTIEQVNPPHN